jgi:hypothetical protein
MATLKNTTINDTGYLEHASGSTAERPASPAYGMLRYNETLDVMEQYTTIGWVGIESPPTISSISGLINEDTDTTLTINGSGFKSGSIVYIEGPAVSGSRSLTTTFVSGNQLTANTNAATVNFTGGESWDLKVQNASGLSAVYESVGTVDRDPIWTTNAGTLDVIYDLDRLSYGYSLQASDPDGTSVTFSIVSGALPAGLTLNSSTGFISGTVGAVPSDTVYPFTVRATGGNSQYEDRSFSFVVKKPVVQTFSYTGSTTSFTTPSGVTKLDILVVGGGGGGGGISGGGGGGGVVYGTIPTSPGTTYPVYVGAGGSRANYPGPIGSPAENSYFSPSWVGLAGGQAGGWGTQYPGSPGGSGAGGCGSPATGGDGGSSTQPAYNPSYIPQMLGGYVNAGYPGASGGNNPGSNSTTGAGKYTGGGGGGAAAAGGHPSQTGPGNTTTNRIAGKKGGDGIAVSITGTPTYYGGGGGGGQHQSGYVTPVNYSQGGAGGGGRGAAPDFRLDPVASGEPGTAGTGGGAGGGQYIGSGTARAGTGGTGIVIVKY